MKTFLEYLENPHYEGSPTKFKLDTMEINNLNSQDNSGALKPLTDEDMARYSAEDVEKLMLLKKKLGINNTKLGDPLDEEGLKKYGLEPF